MMFCHSTLNLLLLIITVEQTYPLAHYIYISTTSSLKSTDYLKQASSSRLVTC